MTPSIYINLDDDVSKIFERIKKERSEELILVCPKRCFLFNDSINLRLLKKQTDLLKKTIHILTMDERGQTYAKEAGFTLKFLPKVSKSSHMSDIGSVQGLRRMKNGPDEKEPEKQQMKETGNLNKIRHSSVNELSDNKLLVKKEFGKAKSNLLPKIQISDNIFSKGVLSDLAHEKKDKHLWRVIFGFVAIAAAIVFYIFFFVLPKGEVIIYPKFESLVRDLEITAGLAIKSPDATKLVIPGSRVQETIKITQKFESKGKKEVGSKATGFVRIYNFTKLPLNLKASTTTLKLAGRNYALLSDINALKPTLYKNQKTKEIDESSLGGPFEISASEGGEEANIPGDTRMEITNQVLGSKPQVVYAKTEGPITGGTSRYLSFVSESDVDEAKKNLTKAAFEKAQDKLITKKLSLVDNGYTTEIVGFTMNNPVGSESPSFEASLEIKFNGLAINIEDLKGLIIERIKQTLAENKSLESENDFGKMSIKFKEIDTKYELGVLSVNFQGKVWYNLSDNLKYYPSEFKGKTPEEVNEILSKDMEINRVDITIAPSWQKTFPKIISNITIKVEKKP